MEKKPFTKEQQIELGEGASGHRGGVGRGRRRDDMKGKWGKYWVMKGKNFGQGKVEKEIYKDR